MWVSGGPYILVRLHNVLDRVVHEIVKRIQVMRHNSALVYVFRDQSPLFLHLMSGKISNTFLLVRGTLIYFVISE